MRCPYCNKNIPHTGMFVDIVKEIAFREVHKHEVDITISIQPAELEGLRKLLRDHGKFVMEGE